jgi:hypothetical protein
MNATTSRRSRRPRRHAASVTYTLALVPLVVLALAAGALAVYAQAGGGYDLTWNTVDAGGATHYTAGGGYTLSGTAGQPDAALWSGGGASAPLSTGYTLSGGFWHAPLGGGGTKVYLPLIVKP